MLYQIVKRDGFQEIPTQNLQYGDMPTLTKEMDTKENALISAGWEVSRHDQTYLECSKIFKEGTDDEYERNFHYHIT